MIKISTKEKNNLILLSECKNAHAIVENILHNTYAITPGKKIEKEDLKNLKDKYEQAEKNEDENLCVWLLNYMLGLYDGSIEVKIMMHEIGLGKSGILSLLGHMHIKKGDFKGARKYCEGALDESMQYINIKNKDIPEEEKAFMKRWVWQQADERRFALAQLTWIYQADGNYIGAIDLIKKVRAAAYRPDSMNDREYDMLKRMESSYREYLSSMPKSKMKSEMKSISPQINKDIINESNENKADLRLI